MGNKSNALPVPTSPPAGIRLYQHHYPPSISHLLAPLYEMDLASARSYLSYLINSNLHVHTSDGRMFVGMFKCTDNVSKPALLYIVSLSSISSFRLNHSPIIQTRNLHLHQNQSQNRNPDHLEFHPPINQLKIVHRSATSSSRRRSSTGSRRRRRWRRRRRGTSGTADTAGSGSR